MAYSYDRTARNYGELASSYKLLVEEIKKAKEQNTKLRMALRQFGRFAQDFDQPGWNPEEGQEELPPEAEPHFVKSVHELERQLAMYDKALSDIEHHEPPH